MGAGQGRACQTNGGGSVNDEAAIRARHAAFMAETPGGEPWSTERRGEALLMAGLDRRELLTEVDRLRALLRETQPYLMGVGGRKLSMTIDAACPLPNRPHRDTLDT